MMNKTQKFQILFDSVAEIIEMPDSDKMLCYEYFEPVSFASNTILEKRGKIPKYQYFVVSGILRNYHFNELREEITTDLNNSPRFFTSYTNFVSRQISQEWIETVTDCELLRVSRDDVDILFEKSIILKDYTIKLLERVFFEERNRINEFQILTTEERYLKFAKENSNIIENVPLKHIASFLGMKPETLSRIRRKIVS
ncbi:Crp/Fnr family transcriptional regulator [soil metagenome]